MQVQSLSFELYTNEEINKTNIQIRSVKNSNDYETVKDNRLGAGENNICLTCNHTENNCYGHWGKLGIKNICVRPSHIQHILYISKFLCLYCGSLKLEQATENRIIKILENIQNPQMSTLEDRLELKALTRKFLEKKNGKCWNKNCSQKFIKLSYSNKKKICFTWRKKTAMSNIEMEYPINKLYEILSNIPRLYWPLINIHCSPENLFYDKNIPIPPLLIRPPNSFWLNDERKETSELTIQLTNLVRQVKIIGDENLIQKTLNEYDNARLQSQQNKNAGNSLSSILIGKTNLMRTCILAGRKDQTCRAVVGPASHLKLWEIGVPDPILNKLGSKIFINPFTISKVKDLFDQNLIKVYFNNQSKKLIVIKKGRRIRNQVTFSPGDWVETCLQENDHMIFGRQPSLHRHNVISSCIKRVEGYSLKIPQVICNSLNGDFDGDEIWGIVEQNPRSTVEQSILMFPVTIILNDLLGIPMYGNIQDDIIAAHLLAKEKDLTLNQVNYLFKNCPHLLITNQDKTLYTGKDVLSLIFNQNQLNLTLPGILENGQLIVKEVDSSLIVGQKTKSLAKLIIETSDRLQGARFINDLSFVLRQYLKYRLYGVIFTDLCPEYSFVRTLNNLNLQKAKEIKERLSNYLQDCNNKKIMRLDHDTEQKKIDQLLVTLIKSNISHITKFIHERLKENPENSLFCMSMAGYKMNPTELMYIMGTYGQQKIGGKRMSTLVNKRILPYHLPGSLDPEANGFVINPLLIGLTGSEYYFTMASARSQIVDIVCETSRTGSLARKIVKKTEDCKVDEYGSVVCGKQLLKFTCNELKMNKQDTTKIPLIFPSPDQEWYDEILMLWNKFGEQLFVDNGTRLIDTTTFMCNLGMFLETRKHHEGQQLDSTYIYNSIQSFIDYISLRYYFCMTNMDMIKYCLLTYLNPRNVKVIDTTLNDLYKLIESRLRYSLSGGYPCGIIFGQTLSEKFTQQALSNFHTTAKSGGVASTLGFDKFLKTVNLSKNQKSEAVVFMSKNKEKLEILQNNFQFSCLEFLCPKIQTEDQGENLIITLTIDQRYLLLEHIEVCQLEMMIENFFMSCNMINKWSYNTEFIDQKTIQIQIWATVLDPYTLNKNKIILFMYGGVYKGKINPGQFPIEEVTQYSLDIDPKTKKPKKENVYKITIIMDNLLDLTKFDLTEVDVTPGIWSCYFGYGIESTRVKLMNDILSTFGQGFDYLYPCCNLLSTIICVGPTPENINTFKQGKIGVMKKITSNDYRAITNAAVSGTTDKVVDNSTAHFTCQPAKVGTGYFNYYIDLNAFKKIKEKKRIKESNTNAILDLMNAWE